ncbi:conserved hypothetical protein [Theileria orientalis strain Shintoku]|uniref:Phosphatidate phosphatase APP1 catalytic domain-containing protein n=1 Tax=Theileria orientalis strain Shintoku TaxID=869250 RepID=J4C8M9_THEOR|nr:conserved hypothetical protein [Theileria orientalis strain Shintoku]PVC54446.1 hypothetical protein MACL_00003073 [Theileria orientalis]BAM41068.1 conserved hypothetical protein [Theileria orientalis strain Shintoku]|eukprot:XP_009691369.1 conserved hypothetical protein [Theileria orientalis strain Shintoku]
MDEYDNIKSHSDVAPIPIHPLVQDSTNTSIQNEYKAESVQDTQVEEIASKLESSLINDNQSTQPQFDHPKTALSIALNNVQTNTRPVTHRVVDILDKSIDWGPTQVIIDIDDTVKSSGGYKLFNVPLGGVDTQYGRGELYPGSFQFILELSMHKMGRNKKPLLLSVLTTRIPQVPITVDSALNMRLREVAERRGVLNWGIDCNNKILYSTLREWVFNEARGEKKFVNFRKLLKFVSNENANARYIWIGDTGDRDLEAGEMMIKYFPGKIRAVFMHCVSNADGLANGMPNDYYLKSVPVLFFKTYVGAAKKAVEHGLLNHNALSRVLVRAVLDLNDNTTSDHSKWKDLIKDILEVEEIANLKRYEAALVVKTRSIIESKIRELSQSII